MYQSLKGKVALVTGGTSGIGKATVYRLHEEGMKVIFAGRDIKKGQQIMNDLDTPAGYRPFFIQADITKPLDRACIIKTIEEKYRTLDVLFNNAGILITQSLEELTEEAWDTLYNTNLKAVMMMTKLCMPYLQKSRGTIINNASEEGVRTKGRRTYLYATSKTAMIKFSQLCALNYAKEVRVNCIAPGITITDIYENQDYSRFSDIPMGRVARPNEIANVVAFLASSEASYMTGSVVSVDGGGSI